MAAGSELTSNAIAPGSTQYGDRQNLEAGLSQIMSGAGGGSAGAPTTTPAPRVPGSSNPLAALASGVVSGNPNSPVTAGMSVGPGPGPAVGMDPMMGDRANRLRALATQAASPALRALARAELRRMVREPL